MGMLPIFLGPVPVSLPSIREYRRLRDRNIGVENGKLL
jgi:hypothetical protein